MSLPIQPTLHLKIEFEREEDGRWIAEIPGVPGAMAYGSDRSGAGRAAKSIALAVLSTRALRKTYGPPDRTHADA